MNIDNKDKEFIKLVIVIIILSSILSGLMTYTAPTNKEIITMTPRYKITLYNNSDMPIIYNVYEYQRLSCNGIRIDSLDVELYGTIHIERIKD